MGAASGPGKRGGVNVKLNIDRRLGYDPALEYIPYGVMAGNHDRWPVDYLDKAILAELGAVHQVGGRRGRLRAGAPEAEI